MRMIDLHNELTNLSLAAGRSTVTANDTGVDLQGYQGKLKVMLNYAGGGGTSPTLDVKIQDSADNSTFADVTGLAFTQVTATASLQSMAVDTRAVRRYIRTVRTLGGSSPTFDGSITAVGQKQES